MKYVLYLRVSSAKQGMEGLGMEVQRGESEKYVQSRGGEIIATFCEVASGWKARKQLELSNAVAYAKKNGAILLCYKIDRLGRKAAQMMKLLDEAKLKVEIVTLPNVEFLTFGILALVAEHESKQISERTKAGLKVRRAQKGDWKRGEVDMKELTRKSNAAKREQFLINNRNAVAIIKKCPECSPTELAKYLNVEGITTAGGKPFTAAVIQQFRKRIERATV